LEEEEKYREIPEIRNGNKNKNKEKLPMEGISFSLLSFIFIS